MKDISIMKDIYLTIKRYNKDYNLKLLKILFLIGITKKRYYYIKKIIENNLEIKKINNLKNYNIITDQEKKTIILYALKNTKYYHRELAYRMIDENIVYLSPSSVYRVLKQANLIRFNTIKSKYSWIHKYSNSASKPDELWQTDITYLKYNNRDVYQLSFIDVYSRFIVFSITLLNMQSRTVSDVFEIYIKKNKSKLKQIPKIQSDNGSCFIADDFKKLLTKYTMSHIRIHPGTPTENVIIERWHKTFKELLNEEIEPNTFKELIDKTANVCYYYNHVRYHSSLGYVTPYDYYRGEPIKIYKDREIKILKAKKERIIKNMGL